jgi:granule-bound starch synthase
VQGVVPDAAAVRPPAAQPAWQIVLLGSGDAHLERELAYLERNLPKRAKGLVLFEERLAHRLVAAADYCVIPSRFEPCGIVALAALRYGAVPIVASTGGLRDIVTGRGLVAPRGGSSDEVRCCCSCCMFCVPS